MMGPTEQEIIDMCNAIAEAQTEEHKHSKLTDPITIRLLYSMGRKYLLPPENMKELDFTGDNLSGYELVLCDEVQTLINYWITHGYDVHTIDYQSIRDLVPTLNLRPMDWDMTGTPITYLDVLLSGPYRHAVVRLVRGIVHEYHSTST